MKKIAILGSTGSIGTQTVDILPSIDAQVTALTTNKRIGLLETQARALRQSEEMQRRRRDALETRRAELDGRRESGGHGGGG